MKRELGAALLLSQFAVAGCNPYPPPDDRGGGSNTNTTNVNIFGPAPSPSPSGAPGTCGPVTKVTNGVLGAGGVKFLTLRLGPPAQSQTLDTTPNDNLDQQCNAFRTVAWTITQAAEVCRINNPTSYTPVVAANALGRCTIRASVQGVSALEPIVVDVIP